MALDVLGGVGAASDMWKQINAQEDANLYAQVAQAAQAAQQLGVGQEMFGPPFGPPTTIHKATSEPTLANRARELFLKRMGGIRAEMRIAQGDYVNCHVLGDTVFLFYVFGGREGCVKEQIDLFPSDQLITQFRLVLT